MDPKELNSIHKNLIVFDDVLLEKQNKCNDFIPEEDIRMLTQFI